MRTPKTKRPFIFMKEKNKDNENSLINMIAELFLSLEYRTYKEIKNVAGWIIKYAGKFAKFRFESLILLKTILIKLKTKLSRPRSIAKKIAISG